MTPNGESAYRRSRVRRSPFTRRGWVRGRAYVLPLLILTIVALPQVFGGRLRVDSGLYAGVSLLAWDGHFWTLMAGDAPYFRKPPLVFWIHGAFFEVLGAHLWVMRLPNLSAAAGCVLLTVHIGRRLANRSIGMTAGIIFATGVPFFRYLKRFILDYWHTLFVLLALWLLIEGVKRNRGWLIALSGLPLGLAMMCKPLLAILTIPMVWIWLVALRKWSLLPWTLGAIVIALVVAAPWHVSMTMLHGQPFIDEYVGRQIIDRAVIGEDETEPWWWYGYALAKEYWPWLITGAVGAWRWARPGPRRPWNTLAILTLIWCLGWLLLASVFEDKRDRYIMHVFPLLALPSAVWLVRWSPRPVRAARRGLLGVIVAVGLVVSLAITVIVVRFDRGEEPQRQAMLEYIGRHTEESYFLGSLSPRYGGNIYFHAGIWPMVADRDGDGVLGERERPPVGALVIDDLERGSSRRPRDEILFSQAELQIIRIGD